MDEKIFYEILWKIWKLFYKYINVLKLNIREIILKISKTVHSIHKYFTGNEFIILENHEKFGMINYRNFEKL